MKPSNAPPVIEIPISIISIGSVYLIGYCYRDHHDPLYFIGRIVEHFSIGRYVRAAVVSAVVYLWAELCALRPVVPRAVADIKTAATCKQKVTLIRRYIRVEYVAVAIQFKLPWLFVMVALPFGPITAHALITIPVSRTKGNSSFIGEAGCISHYAIHVYRLTQMTCLRPRAVSQHINVP